MLCSRCKRPAVVFIATNTNSSNTQGLCLTCAKELGIKPVTDLMDKMGIDDEQLEAMQEQFGGLMNPEELGEAFGGAANREEEDNDALFTPGGAATFPFYKIFLGTLSKRGGNAAQNANAQKSAEKKQKAEKRPKRKLLDTYCYNLTQKAKDGKLDAIIGRDKGNRQGGADSFTADKNNPCLIGEPGVGKTAIAEGLAFADRLGQRA